MSADKYENLAWDIVDYIKMFAPTARHIRIPSQPAPKTNGAGILQAINTGRLAHESYRDRFREQASVIEGFNASEAELACRKVMAHAKLVPVVSRREILTVERIEDRLRVGLAFASGKNPSTFVLPSMEASAVPDESDARKKAALRAILGMGASLGLGGGY